MEDAGAPAAFSFCDKVADLLALVRVEDISPPTIDKRWFVFNSTTTVEDALRLLKEYHLTAIPVKDAVSDLCVGFIDTLDLVGYLVSLFSSTNEPLETFTITELNRLYERFCLEQIGRLVDLSQRNPFIPVPVGQNLSDTLSNLKQYASITVQRVPVVNTIREVDRERKEIINIVSHSAILRMIASHITVFSQDAWKPISTFLPEGQLPVFSVQPHTKAIDAFFQMYQRRLHGVALVDSKGQLCGNLSSSDLRGMSRDKFHLLFLPVVDFLKEVYREAGKIMTPVLSATPSTSLETVILRLAATKMHRLYLVDERTNEPLRVISLPDIMNILVTYFV
ncbi:cell separation during budding [Balamuthia mandrillaris]